MIHGVDVDRIIVPGDLELLNVIEAMSAGALRIILVVESDKLAGVLTDGDIRQHLISGGNLTESTARDVMVENYISVAKSTPLVEVRRLMADHSIQHIPVIDDFSCLLGLHTLEECEFERRSNQVVIMAGGIGERMRPLTTAVPKPLLPINGKPMLQLIIERMMESGFGDFWICINYLGDQIKTYFGDGSNLGATINYISEDKPRGTAGALAMLPPTNSTILVVNGDVLTNLDYGRFMDFHNKRKMAATVCLKNHEIQVPFAVACMESHRVVALEEKPVYSYPVNAGIYAIESSVVKNVPEEGLFDMPDLLGLLIRNGEGVGAFPMHESWLDVGTPENYTAATKN